MADQGDIVLSPLLQVILDKLASNELRDFGSVWGVGDELEQLSKTVKKLLAMMNLAEQMRISDDLIKVHLGDLRDLAYYVDDALDEFLYEARRERLRDEKTTLSSSRRERQVPISFSFCLESAQTLFRKDLAPLINGIREKLVEIESKLHPHYLIWASEKRQHEMEAKMYSISLRDPRPKTTSSFDDSCVFGRKEDVDAIKKMLLSSEYDRKDVPVIAIVGMGGIGKTTLAQLVYNDEDVIDQFDVKAWVCVSEDFDLVKLTRAILESATWETHAFNVLEPLQGKLRSLLRGKSFFLVLDDVWNEKRNLWDALRVPFRSAREGSRIVVTSRSENVSSIMRPIATHHVPVLSDEDCMSLFRKRAFVDGNSEAYPELEAIGVKIVNKCKGLPLAVNALGGILYSNFDENEWQEILESDMWNLEEGNILPALCVSYNHLPSHLKQCFTYCSLFPKDYGFDMDNLVLLWIAEGFVQSKKVENMEETGYRYFNDLVHCSFFQHSRESRSRFVMHDLIHDLAQSVSAEICFRMESVKSCNISKKARHASFFSCNLDSLNKDFSGSKRLSTFLLLECVTVAHVPHYLFEEFRSLRVLDVSNSDIDELPSSIGNLKHLRCLNLSNTKIQLLPEPMTNLFHLQILNITNTVLHVLPRETRNLVNIRHIMMSENSGLQYTPPGIGQLIFLKTLPFFCVGQNEGCKIGELKELQHLQGALCLSALENVANGVEAMESNLNNKQNLRKLKLQWSSRVQIGADEEVLEGLQPSKELEHLNIEYYKGLKFPNWLINCSKLVSLTLFSCKKCKFLPDLWHLPLLETLEISRLDELKHVGHEFHGDGKFKGFQSLKVLTFNRMLNFEEWSGAVEGEFPHLQELTIWDCPKLKKMPPFFPKLEVLKAGSCASLIAIPMLPSIHHLELIKCNEKLLDLVNCYTTLTSLTISSFGALTILPHGMLKPLVRLKEIEIRRFDSLTSLSKDVGLQDLASLQVMKISECSSLLSLPMGLHNLTSLKDFVINDCHKLASFPDGSLPPFLKSLQIIGCMCLESLPKGLHNLTCLRDLVIHKCNCLMSLPEEGLPTSLLNLFIHRCPELQRSCDVGGEDWPKVADIPNVML